MFIKLGIIAGIVILGAMIFTNEIDTFFPNSSHTLIDSLKKDVINFSAQASDFVEQRIDESVDTITNVTSNTITDEITDTGDDSTDETSAEKESFQQTITEKIFNFDPIKSIENIFTG